MTMILIKLIITGIFISHNIGASFGYSLVGKPCENCLHNSSFCDEVTRECLFGCQPGWLEPYCTRRCSLSQCLECKLGPTKSEQCSSCPGGLYGPLCRQKCSENCISFTDLEDTCDFYGNCFFGCEETYFGDKCDTHVCPFENCLKCSKSIFGFLECTDCGSGRFWDQYERVCRGCSGHCSMGANSCDSQTGACYSCDDGWFGSKCDMECSITHCSKCTLNSTKIQCKECNQGYYVKDGSTCMPCDDRNCVNNDCSPVDGSCPQGCQPTWFGYQNFCDSQCSIAECEQCAMSNDRQTVCVKCSPGNFVSSTLKSCQPCPTRCSQDCEDRTGNCKQGCEPGFYGDTCGIPCSEHCIDNTCLQNNGSCICEEGWFGIKCDRNCPMTCSSCQGYADGSCSLCDAGYYGDVCDKKCSEHCEYNYNGDYRYQKCDKISGECANGCKSGYYGRSCDLKCNSGCLSSCERDTGICTSGCSYSVYGPKCDILCPEHCKFITTGYQRVCNMSGGCELGCNQGYYGDFCNKTCHVNCRGSLCDKDGSCSLGCVEGYMGKNCDVACDGVCPDSCSDNCNNSVCDPGTSECTMGCEDGWRGYLCDQRCSTDCNGSCNQTTGACNGGCDPGYYGQYCNIRCSYHCKYDVCELLTGRCSYGCVTSKYYGDKCQFECSIVCEDQMCDEVSGACLSCGVGKYGDNCDQECQPGFYGNNCLSVCGKCRNGMPCNSLDGSCPVSSGCEMGWTGPTCQTSLYSNPEVEKSNISNTTQIIIGCSVSMVAVIILVVVVLIWRRRRLGGHAQKQQEPAVVYRNSHVTIEQPGTSSHQLKVETDGDEDRSDTELLGNKSQGLQINYSGIVKQTRLYKLYKGQMISSNKSADCLVRISELDVTSERSTWESLMNETELLRLCTPHDNVVQLLTTYQNKNLYCMAFETCLEKDLKSYLQELANPPSEKVMTDKHKVYRGLGLSFKEDKVEIKDKREDLVPKLLQFCVNTASAVDHLHKLKVVHRQIEAKHVYVTDSSVAKLGDFHWAVSMAQDIPKSALPKESFYLRTPEQLIHDTFTYPTDVWCLGLLLWEILSLGATPFSDLSPDKHKQMILDGMRPPRPSLANHNIHRLMKNCWRYSGEDRLTARQVLQKLLALQSETEHNDEWGPESVHGSSSSIQGYSTTV